MKILVCISHVPDTTSKINFSENNTVFDKTGVQFVINPNDEFGLTRAIWFKEKNNAVVHVINVGLSDTESTLRKALAIGADKAIRINHNPKDGHSVAKYISNYISNNSYDLIIAGRESIDYNGGMVPGMISAFTDINFIDKCIDLNITGDSVEASREIEGGKENISTKLPLIIGGQKGLVEESDLRIPNMRGIMMARKKELEVVEVNEDYQSTNSKSFEKPLPKGEVTLISADEIDKLIQFLKVFINYLNIGGRLVIISYHSLEDRLVKKTFRSLKEEKKVILLTKKPLTPQKSEINENNKSRSAKFRALESMVQT